MNFAFSPLVAKIARRRRNLPNVSGSGSCVEPAVPHMPSFDPGLGKNSSRTVSQTFLIAVGKQKTLPSLSLHNSEKGFAPLPLSMSRVVTFYSYKGGVGRTLALANIGVLLAKRGKRVLLMDWDLEAPGLEDTFHAVSSRWMGSQ